MTSLSNELVGEIMSDLLPRLKDDDSVMDYIVSIIQDRNESLNVNFLVENVAPFIESYDLLSGTSFTIEEICKLLYEKLSIQLDGNTSATNTEVDEPKLLDKIISLSEVTKNQLSLKDQATIDSLWGFQSIRNKKNETFEATEAASAKEERKAAKEQKKFLNELEKQIMDHENEESVQLSIMTLPDLSGNSREKDIQVSNFNITFGGALLLDSADLRLTYGRRYGLIGRNGVGKTTLLKHMAQFDIEGFPKHHRILYVKQEVAASDKSVLQVVLESDVERQSLVKREKELLEEQQNASNHDTVEVQRVVTALSEIYERIEHIGGKNTEARAAQILNGLQFTEEMQNGSVKALSGGWRMRVSLASALLIEPDLLMLDEPTNHLDLEAVLWLQHYLQQYKHTVLVVSHDRTFLDEVCTDIILFKNQKLQYFRGNFSMFVGTYEEIQVVQSKQREAQQVKLQHMQEFVDKFRYNAKRASLVQSRIKTIEKETVIEEVEEEDKFNFYFPDCGQLGANVISLDSVSFGYESKILFKNVHVGVDQNSRIALVGPNGCGKSTLLKLVQSHIKPIDGIVRVNTQLRLGIFTQHHLDSFDLALSAVENMSKRWPLALEAELRAHLGKFEIHGNDAMKPLKFISGGQKSRVAFACLTYTKPHVVLLDEPTNHLDMQCIEALIEALKKFEGGVLVISHDQHFITSVCNEIWYIHDKKVERFSGEFNDYKKKVIDEIKKKKIY